jgi:phosphoribosylamine-glycine ligase
MVRLKSDLVDLLEHGIHGTLDRVEAEWDRRAALGVVLSPRADIRKIRIWATSSKVSTA